jgi:PhnB protein
MPQTITPYVLYEDADAAIDFLVDAFGFRERLRVADDDGRVTHAELELGDGEIMLGAPGGDFRSPKRSGEVNVLLHVDVDDVDAHCTRAGAAGATIRDEPADQEYGDRRYSADDLEGHRWFFAQRVREVAPEEWGAQSAETRA